MKRGLILIVFLLMLNIVLADSEEIQFTNIPTLNLTTGNNNNVIDLDDYYNGTNLEYKYKAGSKGLNGITIEIDSDNRVDITANNPGEFSVIFIADNDTDDKESNDVKLTVEGEALFQSVDVDFFPASTSVTMKKGEKKTFAVSGGDNVSVEWYLDDLRLPETSGTFEYDAAIPGTKVLKVFIGDKSNTWTIIIEETVVEPVITEPVVVQTSVCGNSKKESGENCGNCPEDVKCASGSVCKNGACIKDEGIGGMILWASLLGIMVIILVVGVIFAKRKGYLDSLNFDFLTKLFKKKERIEEKPSEEEISKEEIIEEKKPGKDLSQLKNYIFGNLKKGYKKRSLINAALQQGWNKDEIDEVLKIDERLMPLANYIDENLKKGYNKQDLIKAALQQGWKQEEINEVLLKI